MRSDRTNKADRAQKKRPIRQSEVINTKPRERTGRRVFPDVEADSSRGPFGITGSRAGVRWPLRLLDRVGQSQLRGSGPAMPHESVNASGRRLSTFFWRALPSDRSSRGTTEYDGLFFLKEPSIC